MDDSTSFFSLWTVVGIALGFLISAPFAMGLFGRNKFDVLGKTVLLTGASEGMGRSVAQHLAAKGANVVIVARNVDKLKESLENTKSSAKNPSTQRFHYISADLSEDGASARVVAETTTWNNGQAPDVVWCMAGSAYPKLFIETPIAKMRQQMDINFWSCVDMSQAILSSWLGPSTAQGKERHLVFTSSVVAFYPIAGYGPYAPGKAAIKSLSDTLAQEVLLYGEDVKIHTVFPGTIETQGYATENLTKPAITHILEESDPVQTAEQVALKAIAGLENGEYLITVGWLGAAMRGCAWGGSARNNWIGDTAMTWITSLVWAFIGWDMDGKVKSYRRKHGHPSTYEKKP